jgi:carbon starvation protein
LVWLLIVTLTAGGEKIFHPDQRIGFLAQAGVLNEKLPALVQAADAARAAGDAQAITLAEKAVQTNRTLHFNNLLDAGVAGIYLVLVLAIAALSVREWILLLTRRKSATLQESKAVWLPDYALIEGKPLRLAGLVAIGIALLRELSGEAQLQREQNTAAICDCRPNENHAAPKAQSREHQQRAYLTMTEKRFDGVRRCC